MRKRLCFKMISTVSTRFRCRQKAPFIVLVFNIFSAVPNRFECCQMHHLASLICFQIFLGSFKLFKIISNAVRINATLYRPLCLNVSLQFQIVSNVVRMQALTI